MSQDYSVSYTLAMASLRASYLSAQAGNMSEAIRAAWTAENEAKSMAVALERERVEKSKNERIGLV